MKSTFTTPKQLTLALAVPLVIGMTLTGCNRGIKPVVNEPTRLVSLAEDLQILQPVFSTSVESSPHVAAMPLQVGYANQRFITASTQGVVSAHTPTGERLWSVNLNQTLVGGVTADAASATAVVTSRDGRVLALDLNTGALRWQASLAHSVLAPVLITQDRVIASANNGVVHGLSLATGEPVWQYGTRMPRISIRGHAQPVLIDPQTVVVATADGRLHGINASSGTPQWSRRFGVPTGPSDIDLMTDIDGAPVVDGNQLFAVTYSGQLFAMDTTTRQVQFVQPVASLRSVAVDARQVVVASKQGQVASYDRLTGQLLWENNDLLYRDLTNPVRIGNYFAVGDSEGVIHVLDAQNGRIVSRVRTRGALHTLSSSANLLYTQSLSGQVSVWQLNRP